MKERLKNIRRRLERRFLPMLIYGIMRLIRATMRIGIVGAENSHTAAISKTINVDKQVKGVKVVALWGETEEFAAKAAGIGQIPTIVKKPVDMIGSIDGVMIDHRHAKYPRTSPAGMV